MDKQIRRQIELVDQLRKEYLNPEDDQHAGAAFIVFESQIDKKKFLQKYETNFVDGMLIELFNFSFFKSLRIEKNRLKVQAADMVDDIIWENQTFTIYQ